MYDNILVPTDGSTGTAHVAMQALDLASQYDATVHALYVIDRSVTSLIEDTGTSDSVLEEEGQRAVGMIERMGESHDVTVETAVEQGDPAETILAYADDHNVDLVVAGTHGRTGIRRHLLGSVAERLVRHSTAPVMTVRLPETDVTVDDPDQARELIEAALSESDAEATVTDVERQLKVWVGTAEGEAGHVVVYLDPITQRTSVIQQ